MVGTTSEVFLGLTLGCARCHNHKFEPLTQHDYYRMVAVFDPLAAPAQGPRPSWRCRSARRRSSPRRRGATTADRGGRRQRSPGQEGERLRRPRRPDRVARAREIARLRRETPDLPRGYFLSEPSPRPPVTHLLLRGQATAPGPGVGPGVPAVLVASQPEFPGSRRSAKTSRRRLALARWLTSPRQPADGPGHRQPRLAVPLRRGPRPHAQRLRHDGRPADPSRSCSTGWPTGSCESGWSLKKLHRLILDEQHLPDEHSGQPGDTRPRTPRTASSGACRTAGWKSRRSATRCSRVSGQLNPDDVRTEHVPADPQGGARGQQRPGQDLEAVRRARASRGGRSTRSSSGRWSCR